MAGGCYGDAAAVIPGKCGTNGGGAGGKDTGLRGLADGGFSHVILCR